MAAQMKVEELRAQLAQRGLTTSGIKRTLVSIPNSSSFLSSIAFSSHSFSHLNVSSFYRSVGSKPPSVKKMNPTLLPHLLPRDHANHKTTSLTPLTPRSSFSNLHTLSHDENEATNCEEKENIVTATKKGAAVLDQWLPDYVKTQYHVLQMGDDIYDAMLNQTNVGDNNNKFYVIQVLESDGGGKFLVYNRWGRVGVKGQDKIHGPYTSRESAIQEFENRFLAKTKNQWSDRKGFVCHPKSYAWLEMDYSGNDKESTATETHACALEVKPLESKLESRVATFISLICNVSMMNQQMMEIGYNANKLPLGKLSKSTILKGYDVLKRIADVMNFSDRKTLEQLSGEFYTVIPHDFGFKKMREFVIDTPQKLKRKLEMVEALSEIEVATKLLNIDAGMQSAG